MIVLKIYMYLAAITFPLLLFLQLFIQVKANRSHYVDGYSYGFDDGFNKGYDACLDDMEELKTMKKEAEGK